MTEKLDGVRGYWDGTNLISRYGNKIKCPSWFVKEIPNGITLDGELWLGQGTTFEDLQPILKSKNGDWSQVGYCVFDVPSSLTTYEERMEIMENLKPLLPPHIHIVKNIECKGTHHLYEYLDSILKTHGEGVMIRKPHSYYEKGLTSCLLKVKVAITFLHI